ncbi:helix-turn-helix domain-containing protein [Hymenobacter sp. H14-R3]|uniref:LexA family transcriptional regulator n=1 Tax=Hymenobacter sp. H14-R3 TaxID=3046308 RepID=UPI0024BBE693|nr:S24 family peptidase [Hymenobacter sp. H14-R3]MDJ0363601.1 helix-turn-helix domain-containing protein [Hymenobacter sp. H14-R3]
MKQASTINERLTKVREALNVSVLDFAQRLELSRGYLNNIEAGRRGVSIEIATFLVEKMNVAPDYILTGRGAMFQNGANHHHAPTESANLSANLPANLPPSSKTKGTNFLVAEKGGQYAASPRVLVTTVDSVGNDNISLVSTRVAAGYATGGFIEPEFMSNLPAFSLPDKAYRNGTFRAFQVSGESMQPTLYEGDWVICRYVDNWAHEITDNYVHVVVTQERPVVKRLLNRLNERGQLTLQSDNIAFPAQFIHAEEVLEIWVAVGRLSRQFVNPRYDLIKEVSRTRADVDEILARLMAIEASNKGLQAI